MNKLLFFCLILKTFAININLNFKNTLLNNPFNKNFETDFNLILDLKKPHINLNNYEGIIFEGGGTKGFYYPGIIRYLEQQRDITKILYLGGTSIGAIIASLIAINYNSIEIENILNEGYGILKSKKFSYFKDLYRLKSDFGFIKGEIFQTYLDQLFEAKTGIKGCTFKQLKKLTNKTLRIGSCCLTSEQFHLFDYQNFPKLTLEHKSPMSRGAKWVARFSSLESM